MALLEASGIGKNFGETHVLKDISLDLEQGEALAIIGSSGSGKTTLLRCLNFLERPDTGIIKVNGETMWDAADPATQKESEIRKKRLHFGLVFQNFNLFPQYTALQNVMLAGELLAKERPEYQANKKLLGWCSISGFAETFAQLKSQSFPPNSKRTASAENPFCRDFSRLASAFGAVQPKRELFLISTVLKILEKRFTAHFLVARYFPVTSSKITPLSNESPQMPIFCTTFFINSPSLHKLRKYLRVFNL